ncbi:N-lysine methyltransferase KMT5A-A-like [Crassostrea virginica]
MASTLDFSRGKRAVKIGLDKCGGPPVKSRRVSPDVDAEFWCKAGLDKDGFEKRYIDDTIGFGVFATQRFQKGAFLLEYVGSRITPQEAEQLSTGRRKKNKFYMFHFTWNGKHVIDATHTLDRLCRFVNDEKNGNAVMKLKVFNHFPRLCLFAAKDIEAGEEIRYDYGNEDAPWRKKCRDNEEERNVDDDDPFDLLKESTMKVRFTNYINFCFK